MKDRDFSEPNNYLMTERLVLQRRRSDDADKLRNSMKQQGNIQIVDVNDLRRWTFKNCGFRSDRTMWTDRLNGHLLLLGICDSPVCSQCGSVLEWG